MVVFAFWVLSLRILVFIVGGWTMSAGFGFGISRICGWRLVFVGYDVGFDFWVVWG